MNFDIKTLQAIDTEYSADTVEWCPYAHYRSYFVCGTYQLEENTSDSNSAGCHRKGRIYLFQFDKTTEQVTELQRMETAAILDMKWLPSPVQLPTLVTVNALGQVEVFELVEANKLLLLCCVDLNPICKNLVALSLDVDWADGQSNEEGITQQPSRHRIFVSDSNGDISLLQYKSSADQDAGGSLEKISSWSAHNFEAWTCAFDKWNPNRIFSGGDDCLMHAWDLRSHVRTLTNHSHNAGVTCLLSHPYRENYLLTGSYDEHLRIFDTRSMRGPLAELKLGGGIWRLKTDPLEKDLLLVACMYENFSLVNLAGENMSTPKLVGVYKEHESICYGSDWCRDVQSDDKTLFMATCSFYDHKLCVSSVRESRKEPNYKIH